MNPPAYPPTAGEPGLVVDAHPVEAPEGVLTRRLAPAAGLRRLVG